MLLIIFSVLFRPIDIKQKIAILNKGLFNFVNRNNQKNSGSCRNGKNIIRDPQKFWGDILMGRMKLTVV